MGFRTGTSAAREQAIERAAGAQELRTIGAGTHLLAVANGHVLSAITALKRNLEVRYAEPDYIEYEDAIPNDSRFGDLWALRNTGQCVTDANDPTSCVSGTAGADIKAVPAWDWTTGSQNVVVGVVDAGTYYSHVDLAANMWSNPGGIGGCPAGTHGYNALWTSTVGPCDPYDPNDSGDHGTHVAGTIGAVGNNARGTTGVNWQSSIMALRFLHGSCHCGTNSDAITVIDFAIQAKQAGVNVRVLNNSWGCCYPGGGPVPYSDALLDEIKKAGANDILFVASAGNNAVSDDVPANFHYPCSYDNQSAILTAGQTAAANIVCVAASDQDDKLASFSNYGTATVQLAAPGVNIESPTPGGPYSYAFKSGTSMAASHVSGVAALVLSQCYQPVSTLKATLLNSVDPLPSLSGKVSSGGRLNAYRAVSACGPSAPHAPTLSAAAGSGVVHLVWSAPPTGGSAITGYRIYRGTASGAETLLASVANVTSYDDSAVTPGTTYYYYATAVNALGEGARSNEVSAAPQAASAPGSPTLSATAGAAVVHLTWTVPPDGGSSITGYKLYRGTASGAETLYATLGTGTSYDDVAVANGTTYYYKVTALNAGEGAPSNEVAATPQAAQPPGAPVLSAASARGKGIGIALSWTVPSNGSSAITGYRIYRSTSAGSETLLTSVGTVTSYKDAATTRGVIYYYKVSAVSSAGEGPLSNEATAKAS